MWRACFQGQYKHNPFKIFRKGASVIIHLGDMHSHERLLVWCYAKHLSLLLAVWVYLHYNFCGGLRKHVFWNRMHNGPSRSSKIVDVGTCWKHICEFLLVINSNFGSILPHFRDIAGFLLKRATLPLVHPNSGGVPVGLVCWCCGSK